MRSFDEFINEEMLFENKVLSPKNVKKYNLDKSSVKKLKSWKYKIKDVEFNFGNIEFYSGGADWKPEILEYLDGESERSGSDFTITTNQGIDFDIVFKNSRSLKINDKNWNYRRILFELDKRTFGTYIDFEDDKILGLNNLLDFLFKKFAKELYQLVQDATNLETLYVIKAGKISPKTGNTDHGWSIYDTPDGMLGVVNDGRSMLWNAKGYKVGDKFRILDDQTHQVEWHEGTITDLVPSTYKDFVAYSRKRGAKVPVAPFKKQTGKFQFTLYSLK